VATPHAPLTHAFAQFRTDRPAGTTALRSRRLRAGLLIGTTALTLTALPGVAAAEPSIGSPQDATRLVTQASHQLEVVSEQVNDARVTLDKQKAAAARADKAAAEAQARLDAYGDQIRQLARSAYTSDGLTQLHVLMTSDSAEDFVSQLGTLDAIAGHTNDMVAEVSRTAAAAKAARTEAAQAQQAAQKTFDRVAAEQKDLQAKIADYKRQYAALTAPQQLQVRTAHAGTTLAAPTSVKANSAAAQKAVNTALAQVGDPYVWGAAGPDAFDCSGLMQYAYSAAGISLPHSSSAQSRMGTPVSRSQLQPGDLVFFYSPVSHVGMYIGNGKMVHASTSGEPVKVVDLDSMGSYNSARRIA